jgi:hypothetical protein
MAEVKIIRKFFVKQIFIASGKKINKEIPILGVLKLHCTLAGLWQEVLKYKNSPPSRRPFGRPYPFPDTTR